MRRSPLYIVAAVVFVSSLLLAFTLPDREPQFQHCIGTGTTAVDCIAIDHRIRERWSVAIAGAITAGVLVWIANKRSALSAEPPSVEQSLRRIHGETRPEALMETAATIAPLLEGLAAWGKA